MEDFKRDEVVIRGDFNLVLDLENDTCKKGGSAKHISMLGKWCTRKQKILIW